MTTDEILSRLRNAAEEKEPGQFCTVYLDNARPADMNVRAFAGHLSALERRGVYRPIDNYAWGEVLIPE